MLRISAGTLKGMRVEAPRSIRPTEERVRQAFFNILGEGIQRARVMDGCAGSGAVGIEALSRGAACVTFIESQPDALQALRANLARVDPEAVEGTWAVVRGDIERMLARQVEEPALVDVIWLDPPYHSGLGRKLLQRLGDCAILSPSGIVCVEHARREELPPSSGFLKQRSQHRYGHAVLSFYERQTPEPHP